MKNLTITGRITKDATLEERSAGKVTNFNVAVNTRKATAEKDANGKRKYKTLTEYYRITLWRDLAEALVPYLTKGRLVGITSSDFVQEVWMDRQNATHPVIHCTNPAIELLDANKAKEEEPGETVAPAPAVEPDELPFE